MEKRITILFGAGAECTAEYGLPSGVEFNKLLISNNKELEEAKKAFYGKNKNFKFRIFNSQSKHIFTQTITSVFKDSSLLPKWLSLEDYIQCRKYEGYEESDDNTTNFIGILCKNYYEIINNYDFSKTIDPDLNNQSNEDMIANFFANNCIFFETLDSKFNLLREYDENKISAKAKRVKDAYITLFLGLVKRLYEPTDYSLKNILNVVSSNDYVHDIPKGVTYYNIVKDTIDKMNITIHLATTNYTNCLYRETNDEDIIYLHGKLNYFEDLKHLVLYNAKIESDKELILKNQNFIIPYILIPSGVKPLICKEQIEAFSNFLRSLNDSKYLFVLGYNFNSEDNHINSLIASWLKENKDNKLIYFSFNSNESEIENEKRSFLEKNTWLESFNEQIIFLLINAHNCYDIFKENLYTYLQKTKEGRKI